MNILCEYAKTESVIKNSRFIAEVFPVTSQAEAREKLHSIKQQYKDATHVVHAFIAGLNAETSGMSDDGEPSGTAGRPALDVLKGYGCTNAVLTITRWFGGTLLGTGGLVRAYQGSLKEALNNSVIIERISGKKITISCDYTDVGKIQYIIANENCYTLDTAYAENVVFTLVLPDEELNSFTKKITESTAARAIISEPEPVIFADAAGEILLY